MNRRILPSCPWGKNCAGRRFCCQHWDGIHWKWGCFQKWLRNKGIPKAFRRLAANLKKEYLRLKICVLADSLYASEPVFKCIKNNGWHFLIRYKDGSIPSVAEEYRSICGYGGSDSLDGTTAREYPRRGKVNKKLHMEWVPELDYRGYSLTLLALEIEETQEKPEKWKISRSSGWQALR